VLVSLILPIFVSAVALFFASSYRGWCSSSTRKDWAKLEERKTRSWGDSELQPPRRQLHVPLRQLPAEMKSEAFRKSTTPALAAS